VSEPVVGIDLGTSNTVVAHADATGKVTVLADEGGYKIHPSVVSFHPNGGVIVGAAAKQRRVIDPQNTIASVKRLIGRSYQSPEVQTAKARMPYVIEEGANHMPMIATRAGKFAIPEISGIVLDHARTIASMRLGTPVHPVARAVVTVPASFNDAQRSATATAGQIAGLEVVRVINEPTAAALAYGHTRNLRETIAVYDFGGGTFDITILKLADQVYEVLGTAGDTFLGGDDLDERIVDKMVAKFLAEHRIDLRTNEIAIMRLRAVAEQTKIELSRRARAVVRVDEIAYGPNGAPLDLHIEIARDELVSQIADIIDRTFPVCQEALALAGIGIDGIADVILVGGTTKIPYVRDQVSKFFARAPRTDVNPEEAVAVGAALQATAFQRRRARTSALVAVPQIDDEATLDGITNDVQQQLDEATLDGITNDVQQQLDETGSGATMAPAEVAPPATAKARPRTAAYPVRRDDAKLDTSYTLTRGGVRDVYEQRAPVPPTPPAIPLARMTKQLPAVGAKPPPPPVQPVTSRGQPVPRGPVPDLAPADSDTQLGAAVDSVSDADQRRPPSITFKNPAPRHAPSGLDAGSLGGLDETHVRAGLDDSFAEVDPLRGVAGERVPVAPASARTLVAAPAPALPVVRADDEFPDEPGPATTAQGVPPAPAFQLPQTFPVVALKAPVPVILDVTPRGLGIGTVAGFCEELIGRNSRLPAAMKRMFTTARDRQDAVRIIVCQGESRRMHDNLVIGDLVLANLPPRPRGETSIEVTFSLDASGILQVRARDAQTGREQNASLDLVGGMAQEDVAASRDRLAALRR